MRRISLAVLGLCTIMFAGCPLNEAYCRQHPAVCLPFLGGQSGSGNGGTVGSGGIVATGGVVGTGGVDATGGVTGAGGVVGTGGLTGNGGTVGTGGTAANIPDAGPGCVPVPGYLLADNGCGGPYVTSDPSTVTVGGFVKGATSSQVYGVLAITPQLALAKTTPDAVLAWTIGNDCVAAKTCLDQALTTANGCANVIQLSDAAIATANIVSYQLPHRPGSVYLTVTDSVGGVSDGTVYVLQLFNLVYKFQKQQLVPGTLATSLFPDNYLVRRRNIKASDLNNAAVYSAFADITNPASYEPDSTCNAGAGNLAFIFGNLPH